MGEQEAAGSATVVGRCLMTPYRRWSAGHRWRGLGHDWIRWSGCFRVAVRVGALTTAACPNGPLWRVVGLGVPWVRSEGARPPRRSGEVVLCDSRIWGVGPYGVVKSWSDVQR